MSYKEHLTPSARHFSSVLHLSRAGQLKRWFLWNFYCLRGRRCADCVAFPEDTLAPGTVINVEYDCGGCGTHYHWNSKTFKRQRA